MKLAHLYSKKSQTILNLAILFCAIVVIIGWQFAIELLKSVLPQFISMKVNTALGFIGLGRVFLLAQNEAESGLSKRFSLIFSRVALAIGTVTLLESIFQVELGVDELFYKDLSSFDMHVPPGRLAPSTSLNFVLLAISHELLIRRKFTANQFITLLAFIISFQAMVG